MALYTIFNGANATPTAALVKKPTGTVITTMLQVKLASTITGKIVEWGWSGDLSAAATPGQVELLETTTVAATLTAAVANDIIKMDAAAYGAGDPTTAIFSVGTTATGYYVSGTPTEGSVVVPVRHFDVQHIMGTNQYVKQFPLGREPFMLGGNIYRIRNTFGASVNCYCYMVIEV